MVRLITVLVVWLSATNLMAQYYTTHNVTVEIPSMAPRIISGEINNVPFQTLARGDWDTTFQVQTPFELYYSVRYLNDNNQSKSDGYVIIQGENKSLIFNTPIIKRYNGGFYDKLLIDYEN